MKVNITKSSTVSITGLTYDQYLVLAGIVRSVKDVMAWDSDTESYTDGGRFLLSMDEDDFNTLNSIEF